MPPPNIVKLETALNMHKSLCMKITLNNNKMVGSQPAGSLYYDFNTRLQTSVDDLK